MARSHPGERAPEVRVIACLDRSSSMHRHRKYALVASLYPRALAELQRAAPGALVETWWFAKNVSRYAPLAPAALAPTPAEREYRAALAGGSAISDCLVRAIERAGELRRAGGEAPTRIVLWTDGWNRLARCTPIGALETMKAHRWVEVYLIGFVDRRVRGKLDSFVQQLQLPPDRVMVFEHEDSREDTHRAATDSSDAFSATLRDWR